MHETYRQPLTKIRGGILWSVKMYPPDGLFIELVVEWITRSWEDKWITRTVHPITHQLASFKCLLANKTALVSVCLAEILASWPTFSEVYYREPFSSRELTTCQVVNKNGEPVDLRVIERQLILAELVKRC